MKVTPHRLMATVNHSETAHTTVARRQKRRVSIYLANEGNAFNLYIIQQLTPFFPFRLITVALLRSIELCETIVKEQGKGLRILST